MKITAIICAAGRGERAGFGKNKLLCEYRGAPLLWHTLCMFASQKIKPVQQVCNPSLYKDGFDQVIVTASQEDFDEIRALCAPFGFETVLGGNSRTESVFNALKVADGDIVLIHDGARPFIDEATISACIEGVKLHGSAVCATAATDTVATVRGGRICDVPPRQEIYSLQTPQGFLLKDIFNAYKQAAACGETFTDDSSVYRRYVAPPYIFEGNEGNKKITFKEDFLSALPFRFTGGRVGFGVDVHAFGKQQSYVTLCGVKIPSKSGLVAHSDGDVAVHAVIDALLSAAGLRDIGYYFPDTDEKYSDADSITLLKKTVQILTNKGYCPHNIALSIQAEKPRLSPYVDDMKRVLAETLCIAESEIAIAAGTCEKLGFVGTGLGICAYACASIEDISN